MKKLAAAVVVALALTGTLSASELRTGTGTDPGDRLDQARMLIFDRDWPKAVAELRRVLRDANEPLRDEAFYWLAQSLFEMGNHGEALDVVERLEREHPRSRWMLPARSLRVDIATRAGRADLLWSIAVAPAPMPPVAVDRTPLVAPTPATPRTPRTAPAPPARTPLAMPGTPRPPAPPAAAPVAVGFTMTDVRIQALSGLLRDDPERAVPVLREIVVDAVETPQARRALFVLGLSSHQDARDTVMHFAQTGPEGLRVVAVEQMARWPAVNARNVLATVYRSSSGRVKLEVLRALGETRADRELIRIARTEKDADLRRYAITQLRTVDTDIARTFLRTVK